MIPVNEIELLIKYREENLARDLPADREVGMEIVNVVREWLDGFLTKRAPDLATESHDEMVLRVWNECVAEASGDKPPSG